MELEIQSELQRLRDAGFTLCSDDVQLKSTTLLVGCWLPVNGRRLYLDMAAEYGRWEWSTYTHGLHDLKCIGHELSIDKECSMIHCSFDNVYEGTMQLEKLAKKLIARSKKFMKEYPEDYQSGYSTETQKIIQKNKYILCAVYKGAL